MDKINEQIIIEYAVIYGPHSLFMKYFKNYFIDPNGSGCKASIKVDYTILHLFLTSGKVVENLKFLCQHFYSDDEEEHYKLMKECLSCDKYINYRKMMKDELFDVILDVAKFDYNKVLYSEREYLYIETFFQNENNDEKIVKALIDKAEPKLKYQDTYSNLLKCNFLSVEKEDIYLYIYDKFKDMVYNSHVLFSHNENFTKRIINKYEMSRFDPNESLIEATKVSGKNVYLLMNYFQTYKIVNSTLRYFEKNKLNKMNKNYNEALCYHKLKHITKIEEKIFGIHNYMICQYVDEINILDTINYCYHYLPCH